MTELELIQYRHLARLMDRMVSDMEHVCECVEELTEVGDDLRKYAANAGTWLVPLQTIVINRLQHELNRKHNETLGHQTEQVPH